MTALISIIVIFYFTGTYHQPNAGRSYARVLASRDAVRAHFEVKKQIPKIIEFDDGIVAYTTGFQSLSGKGLLLDSQAADAFEAGELLSLAYERGYRFIASHYYVDGASLNVESSSDQIRNRLKNAGRGGNQDLEDFVFSVEYIEPTAPTVFIRFERIGSDDG